MKRLAAVALVGILVPAHAARAEMIGAQALVSPLALARVTSSGDGDPGLVLAQRAIEREWPARGDSGVTVMPNGRSELGAMMLSAAVPGSGQVYAGRLTGLYFAALEVVGWLGVRAFRNDADDLRGDARTVAGVPDDSTSAWSFSRYEAATQEDTSHLRELYAQDQEAFDQQIGDNPRYAAGWVGPQQHTHFNDLRDQSDHKLVQSHVTVSAIWINHLVAAFDAMRVARIHNQIMGHGVELKANGNLRHGRPEMTVTLVGRF